jgi:hypothetical protein
MRGFDHSAHATVEPKLAEKWCYAPTGSGNAARIFIDLAKDDCWNKLAGASANDERPAHAKKAL